VALPLRVLAKIDHCDTRLSYQCKRLQDCDGPSVCLDFLLIQPDLHIGRSGHRLRLIAVKNRARMRRPFDGHQCVPEFRGLEYPPLQKKKNARLHKEAITWFRVLGGQTVQSDFTVFREHLAEACRDRKKTPDPLCAAAMHLHFAGVRALDVYRLAKIADELDVSVDWLLGRSDMMELPRHPR
jgi:hypothetical protein